MVEEVIQELEAERTLQEEILEEYATLVFNSAGFPKYLRPKLPTARVVAGWRARLRAWWDRLTS